MRLSFSLSLSLSLFTYTYINHIYIYLSLSLYVHAYYVYKQVHKGWQPESNTIVRAIPEAQDRKEEAFQKLARLREALSESAWKLREVEFTQLRRSSRYPELQKEL